MCNHSVGVAKVAMYQSTETFIFGEFGIQPELSPEFCSKLLERATASANSFRDCSIDYIIETFDKVASNWADKSYPLRQEAIRRLPGLISFSPEMVEEGLDTLAAICSKRSLTERIQRELGGVRLLDGWQNVVEGNYDLRALPKGRVLHLSAGNVFLGAADSLISGIITKNANILKLSSSDRVFPVLFLGSIREADTEGLICRIRLSFTGRVENPRLKSRFCRLI